VGEVEEVLDQVGDLSPSISCHIGLAGRPQDVANGDIEGWMRASL